MRWCSSGMHDAPEKGGEWVEKKGRKGTRRWQCATCKGNKKPPTMKERENDPKADAAPARLR